MATRSNDVAGNPGTTHPHVALVLMLTAAIVVYSCNPSPPPTSPPPTEPPPPPTGAPPDGGPGTPPSAPPKSGGVTPGVTTLCKFGPGGTFLVRVGVTVGNAEPKAFNVDDGHCVDVATVDPASKDDVIVAVAENAVAFAALDHIVMQHGSEAARSMTRTNGLSFEGSHGAIITYYNNAVVSVCKAGTSGTFQYQVGLSDAFHALALADGQCATIASIPPPAAADDVIVTVRENSSSAYRLDRLTLGLGERSVQTMTGTSNVSFEGLHGAVVTFYNVVAP